MIHMADNRKSLSENRGLAKAVAAVCVAFCVLVMGPVKLNARRDDALNVFYNGSHKNYTLSVSSDMREAAEYAMQLASSAEQIVPKNETIGELKALASEIQSSNEPNAMLAAFAKLGQTASRLYDAMKAENPASPLLSDAKGKLNNIENKRVVIEKDSYFSLAREFNAARSKFPASIMVGYAGIDALNENR